ncbi:orotate phosphoribosyltransferase [Methylobacterium organophilum]|uniref:Orotate phosphoribosyltransferase n=1 Tax=Methylobacterium organophilum TaxID=410 RepID=A0ABQ4TCC7_METOR|nr:orotate phosphoribosyltransferase [Methylobacterium organophilum]UMY18165.1 orotate phosphoribosyltransferase [Methylobacterium organophilum]GJE27977.1 Orotate phosphoribosyltransferase [Methylobacterium organophilum]
MTQTERREAVARLLLASGAIQVGHKRPFVLAAGWASPVYVDCRRLLAEADVRRDISSIAVDFIRDRFSADAFDMVAGGETAGIPFATTLADRLACRLGYVRKRPLGVGHNAQVEGGSVEDRRVLLVDDLTTDGTSKLAFVRGLRAAGAVVEHALTIFYHDAFPGAEDRLRRAGVDLHPLATWTDVLRVAGDGLSNKDRGIIEEFLSDPVAWSTAHGGRAQSATSL